jgi:hypothetical protein
MCETNPLAYFGEAGKSLILDDTSKKWEKLSMMIDHRLNDCSSENRN